MGQAGAVHVQKKPGARFNAYDNLLNIRKGDNETLSALLARADKALQDIKALHPPEFTINDLDKELLSMTLICALPTEFNNFASSLLLLDSLDLDKLKSAFQNEESQRLARNVTSPTLALQSSTQHCTFCGGSTHCEKDCYARQKASTEAQEKRKQRNKGSGKGRGKQTVKEASEVDVQPIEHVNAAKVEFAGHASAISSPNRSRWL